MKTPLINQYITLLNIEADDLAREMVRNDYKQLGKELKELYDKADYDPERGLPDLDAITMTMYRHMSELMSEQFDKIVAKKRPF